MDFKGRSFVAIDDFTKPEIEHVFETADSLSGKNHDICKGKILATLFFEPSTRTRLSFESAMLRLGGSVLGFADPGTSSATKGESIADTIRTVESYADIIVMRHNIEGAAKTASEYSRIPIINAGDGAHQHPTQTVLDLYTILKEKGRLDGLKVALCGDLKYGRTTHSLAYGLSLFGASITCIAPEQLRFPPYLKELFEKKMGANIEERDNLSEALDSDVIYMTRIQKERFVDPLEYERVKHSCILTKELADKTDALIMHPLPRVDEIDYAIDVSDRALYFKQAAYGVPVRMALIALLLGAVK
jgi:aspartate carbamoyltransferase catalytic subunit